MTALKLHGYAKPMRLNILGMISVLAFSFFGPGTRATALYQDNGGVPGDYVLGPGIDPNNPNQFDPKTLVLDPNGAPHIAPDVNSVEGVYSAGTSSYIFTITFWNSTIQLPVSASSGADTRIGGYLDLNLGTGAGSESYIDQESQFYLGTGYSPLPKSDYFVDFGTATLLSSTSNLVKVQNTATSDYDRAHLGTLNLAGSQTLTITVPIASLGLTQPASSLTYAFVALSHYGYDGADFAPNGGSPYSMTSVPEASSLSLISVGAAGLVLGAWRRRRRAG